MTNEIEMETSFSPVLVNRTPPFCRFNSSLARQADAKLTSSSLTGPPGQKKNNY